MGCLINNTTHSFTTTTVFYLDHTVVAHPRAVAERTPAAGVAVLQEAELAALLAKTDQVLAHQWVVEFDGDEERVLVELVRHGEQQWR